MDVVVDYQLSHHPNRAGPHPQQHEHYQHHKSSIVKQEVESPSHAPHTPSNLHSSSLPKEDQVSFLHAHFSSASAPVVNSPSIGSDSSEGYSVPPGREKEVGHPIPPPLSRYYRSHQESEPPHHHNSIPGSGFHHPMLTQQIVSSSSRMNVTPPVLGHAHSPVANYSNRPMDSLLQQDPPSSVSLHEITQVTNSMHAPISSLTPLPNEADPSCSISTTTTGDLLSHSLIK